jgi:PGF-pre-PGF domain-containing protein
MTRIARNSLLLAVFALLAFALVLNVLPTYLVQVKAQATPTSEGIVIYYVDKNNISGECSDMNAGSETEPFCTIHQAMEAVSAASLATERNVTVYVRAATYASEYGINAYWEVANGSTLHIRNYPGERVVIDCVGRQWGFRLMGSDITLEGFEITNFSYHGIMAGSGATTDGGVRILDNEIHGCADGSVSCSGIWVESGSGHVISGNEIYGISSTGGLQEEAGIVYNGNDAAIKGNIIHDNMNDGIHVRGNNNMIRNNTVYGHYLSNQPSGIRVEGVDNTLHRNTLYDNIYNIYLSSCDECAASHNLIYSTANMMGTGINVINSQGADISGNTIAFTADFGIRVQELSHNCRLKNNIIYGSGEGAIFVELDPVNIEFSSDYNLFHSAITNPIYFMGTEYGENPDHSFEQYQDESGQDSHSLFQADPVFTDPDRYDFQPLPESPVCTMSESESYIGALPCEAVGTEPPGTEPPGTEPPCSPDWECTEWSAECVSNVQERRCYDWNACGLNVSKPYEERTCTGNESVVHPPVNESTVTNGTEPAINGTEPDITVIMPEPNGTAGADEMPVVIENFSRNYTQISTDQPAVVNIEKPKIGVRRIQINVKRDVSTVLIGVSRISRKPPGIVPNATGIVYQYLNITHENLASQDIDMITIDFDVEKSWVSENNANKSDIYLSRYRLNQWIRLPTRLINETEDRIYYKAISPGLSMFSIMAGSVLSGANRTCVPFDVKCEGRQLLGCDTTGMEWSNKETCEYGCSETRGCLDSPQDGGSGDPWTLIIVLVVLILVLGIAGFYFNSKREGLTEEIREMHTGR